MRSRRSRFAIAALLTLAAVITTGVADAPTRVTADAGRAVGGLPQGASVTVAAGRAHTCALLDHAGIKCWGANPWGQLGQGHNLPSYGNDIEHMGSNLGFVDVGPGRTPTAVSAGGDTTCAILDNGSVKCWGAGDVGQLGNGGISDLNKPSSNPLNLGPNRTARAISVGSSHACALLDDATVKCWGTNGHGQVGIGIITATVLSPPPNPVNLGSGRTAAAISAGRDLTCAVLDNGRVTCWGRNNYGQLGVGLVGGPAPAPTGLPVELGPGRTARAVAAGGDHACAILDNHSVKCWGRNHHGQLGTGGFASPVSSPPAAAVNLGAGRTARAISAGEAHTCAVLDNATVKCWGWNFRGQLGDGTTDPRPAPPAGAVNLGALALGVVAGDEHTCAMLGNGTMRCWGYSDSGRLGRPGPSAVTAPAAPVRFGSRHTATSFAFGVFHACAVSGVDRAVRCWGLSDNGQRGTGAPPAVYPTPGGAVNVGGPVASVVAGGDSACALLVNGTVKCWGAGTEGVLGRGSTSPALTPSTSPVNLGAGRTAKALAMSGSHACAVLDNGTVKCWGANASGQLGVGVAGTSVLAPLASPIDLGAGRTAKALALGSVHSCAILDNNSVKCWGLNTDGQLGDGTLNQRTAPPTNPINLGTGRTATAIAAGDVHTCALLDNATVKCWGRGSSGALGFGGTGTLNAPPVNPVNLGAGRTATAIAAGAAHSCALLDNATLKCWGANISGQLGLNSTAQVNAPPANPIALGSGRTARTVGAGGGNTCAVLDQQVMVCWGTGTQGQTGTGWTVNIGTGPSNTMGDNLLSVDWPSPLRAILEQPWRFAPLNPARLLDSRASGQTIDGQFRNLGLRPAGSTTELQVTGRGGVPVASRAVVLNLTVTGTQAAGFITAYPCGTPRPNASNLNYVAGQTVANLAVVRIGAQGRVCLYAEGATQLLADVTGYQPLHTAYVAASPARLLDSRASGQTVDGQFRDLGRRPARSITEVQVTGRAGIPPGTTAVALNLTATGTQANGFVTAYPCDVTRPNASNLNYLSGQTVANLAVVRVSASGTVCLFTEAAAHLIADLAGAHPASDPLNALTPARLLDTRASGITVDGQFQGGGIRPSGSTLELQVTGRGGVGGGATTAVVNLTVSGATAAGFVTAFPCGTPRPLTSSLNHRTGQTVANLAIVKLGTGGRLCLYTERATHVIADITAAY